MKEHIFESILHENDKTRYAAAKAAEDICEILFEDLWLEDRDEFEDDFIKLQRGIYDEFNSSEELGEFWIPNLAEWCSAPYGVTQEELNKIEDVIAAHWQSTSYK